jgi:hypothetical protein
MQACCSSVMVGYGPALRYIPNIPIDKGVGARASANHQCNVLWCVGQVRTSLPCYNERDLDE